MELRKQKQPHSVQNDHERNGDENQVAVAGSAFQSQRFGSCYNYNTTTKQSVIKSMAISTMEHIPEGVKRVVHVVQNLWELHQSINAKNVFILSLLKYLHHLFAKLSLMTLAFLVYYPCTLYAFSSIIDRFAVHCLYFALLAWLFLNELCCIAWLFISVLYKLFSSEWHMIHELVSNKRMYSISSVVKQFDNIRSNEYVEAYEALEQCSGRVSDAKAHQILSQILLACYKQTNAYQVKVHGKVANALNVDKKGSAHSKFVSVFCTAYLHRYYNSVLETESVQHEIDAAERKERDEVKKEEDDKVIFSVADNMVQAVLSHYLPRLRLTDCGRRSLADYVRKCCKVCWLMVLQDPPLCIQPTSWQCASKTRFDAKYLKEVKGSDLHSMDAMHHVRPVAINNYNDEGDFLCGQKIEFGGEQLFHSSARSIAKNMTPQRRPFSSSSDVNSYCSSSKKQASGYFGADGTSVKCIRDDQ